MASSDVIADVDLRDYGRVLRRRKGFIASTVLVVAIVAMAATWLQRPVYKATAEVLLQPRGAEALFNNVLVAPGDGNRLAKTEVQVIESRPVRRSVERRLGTTTDLDLSVKPVEGSDVVEITSRSSDAKRAAKVANAFAQAYLELRRKQAVDEVLAVGAQLEVKIRELEDQIDRRRAGTDGPTAPPEPGSAPGSDDPALRALVDQQTQFKQRLGQLQVEAALRTGGAQLMAAAVAPTSPSEPQPVRNAVLALAGGLILGIGLAFIRDHLDDAVRTGEDLAAVGNTLPLLGLIPSIAARKRGDRDRALAELNSPAGEAYRALRTSLQLLSLDRPLRRVLITSPLGAEGKTTTTANIGLALARAGEKVVLVDCDLRRPRLHTLFGLDNSTGLTSVLVGDVAVEEALQPVAGEAGLKVLTSGPVPPNPPELLSSKQTAALLENLTSQGVLVLLDSPPVLPVTDAVLLAGQVDATLLVVNSGTSTKRQIQRSLGLLRQATSSVVGAVLNRVSVQGDGYSYDYRYQSFVEDNGAQRRRDGRGAQERIVVPTFIDDPGLLLPGPTEVDRASSEPSAAERPLSARRAVPDDPSRPVRGGGRRSRGSG